MQCSHSLYHIVSYTVCVCAICKTIIMIKIRVSMLFCTSVHRSEMKTMLKGFLGTSLLLKQGRVDIFKLAMCDLIAILSLPRTLM